MGSKKKTGRNQHYHGNHQETNKLKRSTNAVDALMQEAFDSGYQKACDLLALALSDPDIMGAYVMDEQGVVGVYDGMRKYDDKYWQAWTAKVEADVQQEHLDAELREVFCDKFKDQVVPFNERHNLIFIPGYSKARKGWK